MFSERLRALRRGRHITLEELAQALNQHLDLTEKPNTASQIGNWERGTRTPSYIEVRKLADFFEVSLDYLVGKLDHEEVDLAMLFLSGSQLTFNQTNLSNKDRYEIFQLINGYFHGKNSRDSLNKANLQEELDLNI
ncbi:helix-turn-helix domain-containing protein [Periweissella beninensis]|uniref:Helix-turn-helix transcriptional regulator n=1 Tax=Periweissella beninensis TaxID=504936 RepID=A0ABT0VK95_9LACO|nr:helix-turn-helix transcriptional regulator [Periweissella beninensis]MBM7544444.1 transcriptional regulator with XRE-family HTH domain [Periweissella beninensis]MCM2437869.1 helix-turn-helix transcriptional regulator [Periweissella beninensis]MCT4396727.1 XRE family transcriptional regulator [Periweissella beninensis]